MNQQGGFAGVARPVWRRGFGRPVATEAYLTGVRLLAKTWGTMTSAPETSARLSDQVVTTEWGLQQPPGTPDHEPPQERSPRRRLRRPAAQEPVRRAERLPSAQSAQACTGVAL